MFSCKDDNISVIASPNNLLAPSSMAEAISDIQLFEAAIALQNISGDSSNQMNAGFYNLLYKKYKTNASDFQENYNYYLSMPAAMDSIYNMSIEIISTKESLQRGKKK